MGDLRTFFVEKFKASETKDEIEQAKLDKSIKEEILKMEKEIKMLDTDNMAISKLKELITEEIL